MEEDNSCLTTGKFMNYGGLIVWNLFMLALYFTSTVRGRKLKQTNIGRKKMAVEHGGFYVNTNSFVIISELCFVNCQGFVLMRP